MRLRDLITDTIACAGIFVLVWLLFLIGHGFGY